MKKIKDTNSGYIIIVGVMISILGLMFGLLMGSLKVNAILSAIGGVIIGYGIRKSLKDKNDLVV